MPPDTPDLEYGNCLRLNHTVEGGLGTALLGERIISTYFPVRDIKVLSTPIAVTRVRTTITPSSVVRHPMCLSWSGQVFIWFQTVNCI